MNMGAFGGLIMDSFYRQMKINTGKIIRRMSLEIHGEDGETMGPECGLDARSAVLPGAGW